MARESGSRATLARKLVPRSSIRRSLRLAQALLRGEPRRHDRDIAGAAAEMAGERLADLLLGRFRLVAQQGAERDQDARRAEPALQRVMLAIALLQGRQALRRRLQPFDGADLGALRLHCESKARAGGCAVDLDGAGTADAVLAADMRPGG